MHDSSNRNPFYVTKFLEQNKGVSCPYPYFSLTCVAVGVKLLKNSRLNENESRQPILTARALWRVRS